MKSATWLLFIWVSELTRFTFSSSCVLKANPLNRFRDSVFWHFPQDLDLIPSDWSRKWLIGVQKIYEVRRPESLIYRSQINHRARNGARFIFSRIRWQHVPGNFNRLNETTVRAFSSRAWISRIEAMPQNNDGVIIPHHIVYVANCNMTLTFKSPFRIMTRWFNFIVLGRL